MVQTILSFSKLEGWPDSIWQKKANQLISMQLMIYPACCQRQHCLKTQERMRKNRQNPASKPRRQIPEKKKNHTQQKDCALDGVIVINPRQLMLSYMGLLGCLIQVFTDTRRVQFIIFAENCWFFNITFSFSRHHCVFLQCKACLCDIYHSLLIHVYCFVGN